MSNDYHHCSVLLQEALAHLNIQSSGLYVDATYGRGGHTYAILQQLGPEGRLLAIDKDPAAEQHALANGDPRLSFCRGSFAAIKQWCDQYHYSGRVDGVLFDFGVSSPQLEDPARGFSFRLDGPLDMRMNPAVGMSAAEWLQAVSEAELTRILFQYGEEKYARRIARRLLAARLERPISTTLELARLVEQAYPKLNGPAPRIHPATKTFQAIRIHLNQELADIESGLRGALDVLAPRGRLVAISFHSLEDRLVKRFMRDEERGPQLPKGLPIQAHQVTSKLKRLGKCLVPTAAEMAANPRARSAKCRVAERCA